MNGSNGLWKYGLYYLNYNYMGASNFGRVQECTKLWTFWLDGEDEYVCQDTIDNVEKDLWEKYAEFNRISVRKYINEYKILWYVLIPFYNRNKTYYSEIVGCDTNKYYIVVEYGYHEWARFDIVASDDEYFNEDFINKTYNKKLKKTIKEVEKVFAKYTTPMKRVGGFSDGTSLYEKV